MSLKSEINYCPSCRGVWLDRGELDKLLDKAVAASPVAPSQSQPHRSRGDSDPNYLSKRILAWGGLDGDPA
jgi:hypothetical protein